MNIDLKHLLLENELLLVACAEWCGPCKQLGSLDNPNSVLSTVHHKVPSVKIVKFDVEQHQDIAAHYRIMSVPTLLALRKGQLLDTITGARDAYALTEWLQVAFRKTD